VIYGDLMVYLGWFNGDLMVIYGDLWWSNWIYEGYNGIYHLVMTDIATEHPNHKWMVIAGNIMYFYGPFSMAMLNNQRVNPLPWELCMMDDGDSNQLF